jgi:threonine aldolase
MDSIMDFRSDLVAPAAAPVIAAIAEALAATDGIYGAEEGTRRMQLSLVALFGRDIRAFPVASGTAGNALALAALNPRRGAVYCHEDAHIVTSEGGSVEFFAPGARLVTLPGEHGRISTERLDAALAAADSGNTGRMRPAVLSLTQATEAGTVYATQALAELCDVAHRHGLKVHMDGARFANAVAALGVSPAALSCELGIDVLVFGFIKNGGAFAEMIIAFDESASESLPHLVKRAGQTVGKMRLQAAMIDAALEQGRWLEWARHANAMARRLGEAIAAQPGLRLAHPVEVNEVFARIPAACQQKLARRGVRFSPWRAPDIIRFVTHHATTAEHVALVATLLADC